MMLYVLINNLSNLTLRIFLTIKVLYHVKVSAGASVHTLASTVHTRNQHRQQTQLCRNMDYAKPANVNVRRQTSLGFFSPTLYM